MTTHGKARTEVLVTEAVQTTADAIAAAGCEAPLEDAKALVADAMGIGIAQLSAQDSAELTPELARAIGARVGRRTECEPLAYILGRAGFRGIQVAVDSRVLIPRRETGLLVEVAAELPEGARVHEVGTGSGAVALALLNERPDLRVTASDLSPEAAEVARENAQRLGLPLPLIVARGLPAGIGDVDLILANLPYVTDETIFERSPEIWRCAAFAPTKGLIRPFRGAPRLAPRARSSRPPRAPLRG